MAQKLKFRSNYNRIVIATDYEKTEGVSLLVPNQSFTVRELMKRHMAGTMPAIGKQALWDEHPTFDSFDKTVGNFDLVDAEELAKEMTDRLDEIEAERKELKKKEEKRIKEKLERLDKIEKQLKDKEEERLNPRVPFESEKED